MGEVTIKVKDDKGAEVEQKLDDAAVGKLVQEKADLSAKVTAAEGRSAKLKVVEEFAGKYGISPEDLIANAEGAFTLTSKLIESGVIDASGNVLERKGKGKEKEPEQRTTDDSDIDLDALLKGDTKGLTGDAKAAALVMKALGPTLSKVGKSLDELTTVQTGMLRNNWEMKIQGVYPNLTGDDVRKVFSEAAVKPKQGLLEIAKELSEAKSKTEGELRKKHAQEFGINVEEFDANKLKEKGSAGGAAGMFQGAKFTLSKRRAAMEGSKFVDPTAATKEYLRKQGIIR